MLDVANFLGVGEHAAEQANGADGGGRAARYASKAAGLGFHGGGSLAAHDGLKEALDVGTGQVLQRPFAEQRHDVAGDPPTIDFERAGLLG